MKYSSVDLHCHSTISDGHLAPAGVVALAAERGILVLALTDHDTLQGVPEAQLAGQAHGVYIQPGVEISAKFASGQCHLLAWLPDPVPAEFAAWIAEQRDQRANRAKLMIERLQQQGIVITWDAVCARAQGTIGRPHIAAELVAIGACRDTSDAFDRLIGNGCTAHVPSGKVEPEVCIQMAVAAGALVSLAHPGTLELDDAALGEFVDGLVDAGLGAIEAHRGDHSPERQAVFHALAGRYGLVVSGGSDFHHENSTGVPRGVRILGWHGDPGLSTEDRLRLLSRLPGVPAALVR